MANIVFIFYLTVKQSIIFIQSAVDLVILAFIHFDLIFVKLLRPAEVLQELPGQQEEVLSVEPVGTASHLLQWPARLEDLVTCLVFSLVY